MNALVSVKESRDTIKMAHDEVKILTMLNADGFSNFFRCQFKNGNEVILNTAIDYSSSCGDLVPMPSIRFVACLAGDAFPRFTIAHFDTNTFQWIKKANSSILGAKPMHHFWENIVSIKPVKQVVTYENI